MNPQRVPSGQTRTNSGHESERRYESLVRTDYERCHPDDSFDDLKHRAHFTKEDRGLLRDWLATAARPAGGVHRKQPGGCVQKEARNND